MMTARLVAAVAVAASMAATLSACGPHWVTTGAGSSASPIATASPPSSGMHEAPATVLPSPTRGASPTPSAKPVVRQVPRATPSRKPIVIVAPPARPRPPTATRCGSIGPDAAKPSVRAALVAAAGREYWTKTHGILAPLNLLKAIAWQESGWQSGIVACDGGLGTMQIMPDTAVWLNNRFGSTFEVKTLDGNTLLGAEYVAWLIKYFGDVYYANAANPYSLDNPGLLNAVISAYNVGADAVDPSKGTAGIPNPSYVSSVRALMANCPCSAY